MFLFVSSSFHGDMMLSWCYAIMMTSSIGNIFRVTGPLWGESTGDRLIPPKIASDAELWHFLWSALEQTVDITIKTPVIWDAIALIMTSSMLSAADWINSLRSSYSNMRHRNRLIIRSGNELLPARRQAIELDLKPIGRHFTEYEWKITNFSFGKIQ